jgi:hypothetical protein
MKIKGIIKEDEYSDNSIDKNNNNNNNNKKDNLIKTKINFEKINKKIEEENKKKGKKLFIYLLK